MCDFKSYLKKSNARLDLFLMSHRCVIVPLLLVLLVFFIFLLVGEVFGFVIGYMSCTDSGSYYYVLKHII